MTSTSQPAQLVDLTGTQPSYESLLYALQAQLQQGRTPLANMPYMQYATSAVDNSTAGARQPAVQAPRTTTAPNVQNTQRVNAAPAAAVQPVDKATNAKKRKAPAQQESAFPLVDKWLCGSQYVEIKGKTLKAYDCGGEIFRVQRGRGVEDLMAKFEAFLAAHPDGNYFN